MEGGGGGGVKGAAGVEDDMGEASMICSKHPFKSSNNNPGGICAFCLQDKLGKLVSSSFPMTIFPSSSSSSPSSRSESFNVLASGNTTKVTTLSSSSSSSISHFHNAAPKDSHFQNHYPRRARFPFLSTQKKKKKKEQLMVGMGNSLKRSKSTTTPRNDFLHAVENDDYTPHRRRFWSFLYLSSKPLNTPRRPVINQTSANHRKHEEVPNKAKGKDLIEEEVITARTPASTTSFERKVSRSRSVGCGSRSFSGDLFERISTGLGDCTLRRVESQREGKSKVAAASSATSTSVHGGENHHCIKERVRCGGIFGGFIMTSSSSSSSSSIQWVPSSAEDAAGPVVTNVRSKNWAWAFASPMRAFTKPSSNKDGKSGNNTAPKAITAPNLAAMPSLLAVRT